MAWCEKLLFIRGQPAFLPTQTGLPTELQIEEQGPPHLDGIALGGSGVMKGSRVFLSLAKQVVEQLSLGAIAIRRRESKEQSEIKARLQQMLKVTVTLLREYDCFKELRSVEELGSIFYRANCTSEEFPTTPATLPAEAEPKGCCEVAAMQVATKL